MRKCKKENRNNFDYLPTIMYESHKLDIYTNIMINYVNIEDQHGHNPNRFDR
jgi:hypothetical protein